MNEESRDLHSNLLKRHSELHEFRQLLEFATLCRAASNEAPYWTRSRKPIRERAEILGFDPEQIEVAAQRYIDSDPEARDSGLHRIVQAREDVLLDELKTIPPSIAKVENVMRIESMRSDLEYSEVIAWVSRGGGASGDTRRQVAADWLDAWTETCAKAADAEFGFKRPFWVSRDTEELFDDLAYLRVYEAWGLTALDEMFEIVISEFGFQFIDILQAANPFSSDGHSPKENAHHLARFVYFCSFSTTLATRFRSLFSMAAIALQNMRDERSGFWMAPVIDKGQYVPCAETTAIACAAMLRVGDEAIPRSSLSTAANWLLAQQREDGSWADCWTEPSEFGTAAGYYVLRRIGPRGSELAAERALTWLLTQQSPQGVWLQKSAPPLFHTAHILECLSASNDWIGNYPDLESGVALVMRGWDLRREHSAHARQLSVIAIFTGLESVLYACLRNPIVDIDIHREDRRTIGYGDALAKMRAWLREKGIIGENSMVPGAGSLGGIADTRDAVVHRGQVPSVEDLERFEKGSCELIGSCVANVFGLNPFEH